MSELNGDWGVELPPSDADDVQIAAWVRAAMSAMDNSPHQRFWRRRVLGTARHEVIANGGAYYRLDLKVPIDDMRQILAAARERELPVRTWTRQALATAMVVCEGVHPDDVPWISGQGLLVPR